MPGRLSEFKWPLLVLLLAGDKESYVFAVTASEFESHRGSLGDVFYSLGWSLRLARFYASRRSYASVRKRTAAVGLTDAS